MTFLHELYEKNPTLYVSCWFAFVYMGGRFFGWW